MVPRTSTGLLLVCLITAAAGAQLITNATPPLIGFVDISMTGGTMIAGIGDDSEHSITTTVGNALFPAGAVCVSNNGVAAAVAGVPTIAFTNATIAATGVPVGLPAAATGILCTYWDDLYPAPLNPTEIWWQEASGILVIMWKNENHFASLAAGEGITFEIQIFSAPGIGVPWVQILYPDATFGGTMAVNDAGASATVGYVKGTNPIGSNTLYSFNTAGAIPDGTTLSIYPPMLLTITSPFGPGSLQVDIGNGPSLGTYFLCVTLNAGAFPSGYFFGISPSFQEILGQVSQGFPFVGPLDSLGNITLGPIGGVPSGFTFYSVAIGFDTPFFDVPSLVSAPKGFTIP